MLSSFRVVGPIAGFALSLSMATIHTHSQNAPESHISQTLSDAEIVQFSSTDRQFAASAPGLVQERVCSYAEEAETSFGQEMFSPLRTARVYIPPRSGALSNAIAAAALYLDFSRAAEKSKVTLPETWEEVGLLLLERNSSVLHHYYLAVEYRNGREKELARLRGLTRDLSARLGSTASLKERLPVVIAKGAALWFENCEDVLPLYRKLLGSPADAAVREELFFRPGSLPLVTAWTWDERKKAEQVERRFIEGLCSSNEPAAVQIDGLVLAASIARSDRSFAAAFARFVESVQPADARAAYSPIARQLLDDRRHRSLSEKTREELRALYQAQFLAPGAEITDNDAQAAEMPPTIAEISPVQPVVAKKKVRNDSPRPREIPTWRILSAPGERLYWETMPVVELRALAANADVVANYYLFLKLRDSEKTLPEAERSLTFAAKAGFPQALLEQAKRQADPEERFELTSKAAASGYPAAQLALGELLIQGEGTVRDHDLGLSLVRSAYDLKLPEAEAALAQLYASAIGAPRTQKENAAILFLNAARADVPDAMIELHHRYFHGYNVLRDQLEASRWLVNAAMHNRQHLAKFLDPADGTAKPQLTAELDQFARTLSTYAQAVIYKQPEAIEQLAEWYEKGSNGRKNKIRACALLLLAQESGASVPEAITRLRAQLSKQEVKTAELLAVQWRQIKPDVL